MRVPLIAGNWKMNMTTAQAVGLVDSIRRRIDTRPDVDVVVCPPFTSLCQVHHEVRDSHVMLGAQGMFWMEGGAFTGQISPKMLIDLGVSYVIIGHSETRGRFGAADQEVASHTGYFSETDATVNKKIHAALFHSLTPILCVGETLQEREADRTDDVVHGQLKGALADLDGAEMYGIIVAYEPVWAIGTGQVCDDAEANRVCGTIRATIASIGDNDVADNVRILYGGSVKASNADGLLRQAEIDGALVGGASLDAEEFVNIVYSSHQ